MSSESDKEKLRWLIYSSSVVFCIWKKIRLSFKCVQINENDRVAPFYIQFMRQNTSIKSKHLRLSKHASKQISFCTFWHEKRLREMWKFKLRHDEKISTLNWLPSKCARACYSRTIFEHIQKLRTRIEKELKFGLFQLNVYKKNELEGKIYLKITKKEKLKSWIS